MNRFLFLLMFLCHAAAFAKSDTQYGELLDGTTLVPNATLSVAGNRYNGGMFQDLATRGYWVDKSYGLVKLSLPAGSQTLTGTATVTLNITYHVEGHNTFVPKTETGVVLTVSVNADNATDASYFLASNAHAVQIEVVSFSKTANLSGLKLSTEVITESFDYLLFSDVPATVSHATTLTGGGSLPVSWAGIPKAESYELEWTYISNQSADEAAVLPFNQITIPPYYFRNNSSRVEVTATSYNIPLVYEAGYILYRVRAVGKSVVNSTAIWVKSNWTYLDNGTDQYPATNAYLYAGLENNINWQSSLSFAEEGKHKVVVSYHDGSSRNRQAVTRINTDERAVVGETFYDYNGRPIIQTLPVPVKKDSVGYYPAFNVVEGKTAMQKEDITDVGTTVCNPAGAQFSNTTGSANYYSPSNTFGTNGNTGNNIINKELIPDAKKYPYAQTVYTPDNTGRVATQSGIGEANYLGSGHETKYLYATPLQSELCRLFGTQVGYAAHYKKNTVIDPNGQVSVSYLDLDGKVVATALAGGAPDNVASLGNANSRAINEDLIKTNPMSNSLAADTTSLTFNKKFVVTSKNLTYAFAYTGEFGYYDIPCKTAGTYNHIDGVVDVTVTLKDKCGAVVFSTTKSTVQGNTGARQSILPAISQTAQLNTGEYQLTKEAVINEDKLAAYTQDYLASACAKQLQDFKAEEEAKINLADCNLTCASCETERNRLLALEYLTAEQKLDISNLCASICDKSIGCSSSLNMMKADLSPGGQYAELYQSRVTMPQNVTVAHAPEGAVAFSNLDNISIDKNTDDPAYTDAHPELFPLSVFNANNRIPLGSYLNEIQPRLGSSSEYWRFPITITRTGDVTHPKNYQILNDGSNPIELTGTTHYKITDYLDDAGEIFYVYIQKTIHADNTVSYFPEILDTAVSALLPVDATLNRYKIPVRYLKHAADFEGKWKTHWAYALLPYHPEFPYYIACIAQNGSNDFDYKLMNTTFADAKTQGYIDENGVPTVFEKEGLENGHVKPVGVYTAWMNVHKAQYQNQGISMALLANRLTNCPTGSALTNVCGDALTDCDNTSIDTEEEWSTYRSLYFSVKQKFLKTADMYKAVNQNYYNGCIGHANYTTVPEAYYFSMNKPQVVNTTVKVCSRFLWMRRNCGWRNYSYTMYVPSYFIQSQLCYAGNAPYFVKKTQRFYPTASTDNSATQQTGNCPEVTYDDTNIPVVSLVPCAADLIEQQKQQIRDAQRLKYELCGLCPVASDLESVLMQLVAANKLKQANTSISCAKDNVILGDALKDAIIGVDATNPFIYWVSTLAADKKSVTGLFQTHNTTVKTLTLMIPAGAGFTFDQLSSICCLTPSQQNNNAFTLKASFRQGLVYTDVLLNGTINLNLTGCAIVPKCILTADAANVATLLNILSADGKLETMNAVHLFAGIDSEEDDGTANVNKYFDAVLNVLRMTDTTADAASFNAYKLMDPTWTASTSGGIISGTLTYTVNTIPNQLMIEIISTAGTQTNTPLTLPAGGTYAFPEQPKQFHALSPVSYTIGCTSGCGSDFGASMISVSGNQFHMQKVVISVPLLSPVKCTPVIPATVNRN